MMAFFERIGLPDGQFKRPVPWAQSFGMFRRHQGLAEVGVNLCQIEGRRSSNFRNFIIYKLANLSVAVFIRRASYSD
jgi:hypothetical protein